MQNTRVTLLQRAGSGAKEAWFELDELYRPFVRSWFRSQGVASTDGDDLTQEVLAALFKELPEFSHSGRTGSFRAWLRTMCLNRLLNYRRVQSTRGSATGGTDFYLQVQMVAEDDPLVASWDREHDQLILRHLFAQVENQFERETLAIFRELCLHGRKASDVAAEFHTTTGAVYVARSRVLRRLREEAERFLGEELPDPPNAVESNNTETN